MRKVTLMLVCGLILLAAGSVFAKSEWAKYRYIPVPDSVKVPQKFIDSIDGTLDCCGCHWNTNHDGPQFCD